MSAKKRYVIDKIEALGMVDVTDFAGDYNAIPNGVRVHVISAGGDAWLDWPADAGDPVIGALVFLGIDSVVR